MGCFHSQHSQQPITIHFHRQNNPEYANNQVKTTKYTWWSFFPKAIIIQFIRPANFVYLLAAILQSIDVISSLTPITAIAPFVFVLGISLLREGFQDYRRYKTDKEINSRKTHRLFNKQYIEIPWEQIQVGDIIKVKNNQTIPADILLLHTSEQNSLCYVETANLDGQTNLKAKFAHIESHKCYPQQYQKLQGKLIIDPPNSNLNYFSGYIRMQGQPKYDIDFENMILRETVVKNTDEAVGIVLYAGYNTKIIQNQGIIRIKVSKVQKKVNVIQLVLLAVLIVLSASCSIGFTIYHSVDNQRDQLFYLIPETRPVAAQSTLIYFSSFLLLTFFIPISLNVSIEVIKVFLGVFLNFDDKMYYQPLKKRCNVNNFSIVEELGNIEYVLTDKTGTLTANQMIFKQLVLGKNIYNSQYLLSNHNTLKNDQDFHNFWLGLIICHDVVCDPQTGQYQGSSPDQVCFINFARQIGYQFVKRTRNSIQLKVNNQKIVYELQQIIAFSPRKRMSVIVKNLETMKIKCFTKGADSSIFEKSQPYPYQHNLSEGINDFAKQGFRTLVFAHRQFEINQYQNLRKQKEIIRAHKLKKTLSKQQIQLKENEIVQTIESKLKITGATAIQDHLQEKVPQTIARLQEAGITVMMITGDKLETAQNIGYLANFIKPTAQIYRLEAELSQQQIITKLTKMNEDKQKNQMKIISLIIQGTSIKKLLQCTQIQIPKNALKIASSVIFCRSSPKQKAQIVQFVKQKMNGLVLAIGDGGNDVGMIQSANVGVGILGKEGNSACVVSDFSIGQFHYLDRLILHHGRWFYYRLSYFFVYYGWKNLMMSLLLYYFMTDSAFSALAAFSDSFIGIYNILIGLCLVVYYSIFEQDINDDQYPPAYCKLPIYYKQINSRDLFSYKRYLIWTMTGLLISIFIFISVKYSIGSNQIIGQGGQPGDIGHLSQSCGIILAIVSIMVLIMDIKMYTWFSTLFVIVFLTIIGCLIFFLIQNFVFISVNIYTWRILNRSSFRFWAVIFLNVALVYAVKLLYDTLYQEIYPSQIDKAIKAKQNKVAQNYSQIHGYTEQNIKHNQLLTKS